MISDELAALTTCPECGGPLFSNMVRTFLDPAPRGGQYASWGFPRERQYVDGRECRKCHEFFTDDDLPLKLPPAMLTDQEPPGGIPCTAAGVCTVDNRCGNCGVKPERRASVEALAES